MPKIGLLTVHCSTNFGASLQAYALGHYLKDRGNDVEIINYRYKDFLDVNDLLYVKENYAKYLIKKYLLYFWTHGRYAKFLDFENNYMINESHSFQSVESWEGFKNKYEICVVGSDQVWNPNHINFNKAYFFGYFSNVVKASFAASLGKGKLSNEEITFLQKYINDMDYVSVREESARKILKEICFKGNIQVHADPVFLFSIERWRTIEKAIKTPCKYAVVYVLGGYDIELCKKIIGDLKKKIKIVTIKPRLMGGMGKYNIGPQEYLYLLDHAEIVLTNSFHGAAFSILFKKQLIAIKSQGKNERLSDLFNTIDISNVQIDSYDDYKNNSWYLDNRGFAKVDRFIEANLEKVDSYFTTIGI